MEECVFSGISLFRQAFDGIPVSKFWPQSRSVNVILRFQIAEGPIIAMSSCYFIQAQWCSSTILHAFSLWRHQAPHIPAMLAWISNCYHWNKWKACSIHLRFKLSSRLLVSRWHGTTVIAQWKSELMKEIICSLFLSASLLYRILFSTWRLFFGKLT